VTEMRADGAAPSGLLYPLIAGLAVGVLVVGVVVGWLVSRGPDEALPPAPTVRAPSAAVAPAAATAAPAAAAAASTTPESRLAWLDRAAAPQARVERERSAAARAQSTRAGDAAPVAAAARSESAPAPMRPAGRVSLESVRWAAAPERRTVTLRLDGRRVTLRQGERAAGIEVQLIMEDGAYLDRGTDVFFAVPE
jgi:hypothetical protein